MDYRRELANFTTPVMLKIPNKETKQGVRIKSSYTDSDTFNCSWKSKGGTEVIKDGTLVIENTAEIVCWYNSKIEGDCHLLNMITNKEYEIVGEPENIDNTNKFMKFKIRYVGGKR